MTYLKPSWTTLREMQGKFKNDLTRLGNGIVGVRTSPAFAIAQEAYLLESEGDWVLWDCISFVDAATILTIKRNYKIRAIVISHPHFVGSMVEWSELLGDIPIYVHNDNRPWVPLTSPTVTFWEGDRFRLTPSVTIVRTGGHFAGSCVLHRSDNGGSSLFTSDTIIPVEDRRWVSFMYSYPNLIPLGKRSVAMIAEAIADLEFEAIYGGPMYGGAGSRPIIASDGKAIVLRSIERYLLHLSS